MNAADTSAASLLETLRLARGLTQVELADAAGMSQALLSKVESGKAELSRDRREAVAALLQVPIGTFNGDTAWVPSARIFHRRQKSASKSALSRVRAELELSHVRVESILGDVAPALRLKRRPLPDDGFTTPGEIAALVRADLGLGHEPIADLTRVLEEAGVVVIRQPLESLQVDAIAGWPDGGTPVILLADHAPAERQRFTMAHELGHATMHDGDAAAEHEKQADAFASEFLVPGERLRSEWKGNALPELIEVKKRWGISLSALIRRGWDLGLMTDYDYRAMNIQLTTSGMHRREPDSREPEQPQLLRKTIAQFMAAGTSIDALATRAIMLEPEFTTTFLDVHDE
ncbi:ImmA/IrrE family metallo-endopeptidase [Cryobacterium sp. 10S3]|uniref:ImmA/IrrE family metallo-endopeptidase n=1 Tax=Cryobacterium sp. 10S3 TaxID=3048582 RepID=UPI002AC943D9|nr:ImmA/IrrE family metallo-endopeptidase [Cryobacterium sp. 10S3]MEB0287486.1 ImmA/IrrE family metallo-endopeptidase [Cryobacterium sp. 10S3]WPX13290.1 ImmA/IrrE family metallo-endopeptidase [Cryobacterium sp. 10S3]